MDAVLPLAPLQPRDPFRMTESTLIKAYREYEADLRRFLAKRLRSVSLAADIVQDLYLKLLAVEDHAEIRDRKSYLFSMAANLATDHQRVEARRQEILAEVDGLVWRQQDELTPERYMMAQAELQFIEKILADLPERSRQVFHLNRFEGKSQAEIATRLGLGVTTVYKDLKMVMDKLLQARRQFRAIGSEPVYYSDDERLYGCGD